MTVNKITVSDYIEVLRLQSMSIAYNVYKNRFFSSTRIELRLLCNPWQYIVAKTDACWKENHVRD